MMTDSPKWALILGGSSGLGLATAQKLSSHGYNLCILHRDRRSDMDDIESQFQKIKSKGVQLLAFNADATNPDKIKETLDRISGILDNHKIKVLVHSIAKGNLKPMLQGSRNLQNDDFHVTIDAMAISLYDWVRHLFQEKLLAC